MKKKPWELAPHERERKNIAQKLAECEDKIKKLQADKDWYRNCYLDLKHSVREETEAAGRYTILRQKELVVFDGETKYLTGEDLDKYCDALRFDLPGYSFAKLLAQSLQQTKNTITTQVFQKVFNNDTRSESEEADTQDSGHDTSVLRDADGDGVR